MVECPSLVVEDEVGSASLVHSCKNAARHLTGSARPTRWHSSAARRTAAVVANAFIPSNDQMRPSLSDEFEVV